MAKRGGFPGGMPGNMNNLMKQAQKMQRQMEEAQKELEEKEVTAAAGGGAVEVTVSGKREVLKVKLQEEVVDPDDVEMLEAAGFSACVAAAPDDIKAIVDQVLVQILKCIYSLSIMRIDGIILICIEQEVITAASHRTDPWNIVIVLDDRHETGDASLYRCFINDSCVLSSALWSAIGIVAKHNCDGTSVANADRYILSGKITLHGICPGFLCLYRYCGSCKCAGKQHSCEKFKYFFLHVFSSLCIYI